MKQAIKKNRKNGNGSITKKRKRMPRDSRGKVIREHHKFGTSKLEQDFAKDFLDKLGVKYIWQFEAKDIKRSYDFFIEPSGPIIEIDGSYYHSDPRLVKEEDMNPMQKKNKRVDELKNKWALLHGIPIYRIWEIDIRKNPEKVMEELKEILHKQKKENKIKKEKNKRHKNRLFP